ncbi:MAG: 4-(cytidine 5'-diphospho)-2-C-methyl-D-erythritol kinase [Pirellulaceae bacterium]
MEVSFIGASVRIHTPAKLNLFLEVLAERSDGFHEIETLMAAVRVYDTLYIEREKGGRIQLTCRWAMGREATAVSRAGIAQSSLLGDLPEEKDNLVWRAVERLRQCAEVDAGVNVRLIKRIPAAAGLGGASSDAAAALAGANLVWRLGWSRCQLSEIAAEIGSDVPFFLHDAPQGAGMAVCRGRGERMEPLAGMPHLHFVIVRPPEGLSTAEVYRNCRPAERPMRAQRLVDALRRGISSEIGSGLFNRLQTTAAQRSVWVNKTRRIFDQIDCLGHQMSGSGTSYFAICRHARHARRLLAVVRAAGFEQAFRAETTTMPPYIEAIPA